MQFAIYRGRTQTSTHASDHLNLKMASGVSVCLFLAFLVAVVAQGNETFVVLSLCGTSQFSYDSVTQQLVLDGNESLCVEWNGQDIEPAQTQNTFIALCASSNLYQKWIFDPTSSISFSSAASPSSCLNVQGFGTDIGHEVTNNFYKSSIRKLCFLSHLCSCCKVWTCSCPSDVCSQNGNCICSCFFFSSYFFIKKLKQ